MPSQIPFFHVNVANSMTDRRMDEWTDSWIDLLLHMKESYSKFGLIPPNGLRGDSMTYRWTDPRRTDAGWKNNIAHTHPYYEGKSYSKFG